MFDRGDMVRVRKVGSISNRTARKGEWVPGALNPGLSPEMGYDIEGKVVDVPRIGVRFCVARTKRMGVVADGDFATSTVVSIHLHETKTLIKTENSLYEITLV